MSSARQIVDQQPIDYRCSDQHIPDALVTYDIGANRTSLALVCNNCMRGNTEEDRAHWGRHIRKIFPLNEEEKARWA